jgi:hypothetical protein
MVGSAFSCAASISIQYDYKLFDRIGMTDGILVVVGLLSGYFEVEAIMG